MGARVAPGEPQPRPAHRRRRRANAPAQVGREEQAVGTGGDGGGFGNHVEISIIRPPTADNRQRLNGGVILAAVGRRRSAVDGKLIAKPPQRLPTAGDVGQWVPQTGDDGAHRQQGAVGGVGHEGIGAAGQHRGRAGHVKQLPRPHDARAQGVGGRVAAAGGDGRAHGQAKVARRLGRHLADDPPRLDDLRQPAHVDPQGVADGRAPRPGPVVAHAGEVDKGVVHERAVGR